MRSAIVISAVLHTGVVLAAWLGLPLHRPDPLIDEHPVFVEIVDVDETRNAPPMPVQETPKEQAKPEPPKETPKEVKVEPPKPAPPKPAPPKPEIAALPPKPEAEPEPKPLPKAKPEPEPEPEKVEKPKSQLAQVKVPKKPERPKKPTFDTASVLKTLEKMKQKPPAPKPDDTAEKKKPEPPKDDTMARIRAALQNNSNSIKYDPTKKVSQLEINQWQTVIHNQVSKCWSPPYGAPGAEKLKPELTLTLNPDGSVQSVEVEDTARMFSDRYFQVAVEAARRAVLDPRCNKFDLPADKYHVWRDLKFVFDPSGML